MGNINPKIHEGWRNLLADEFNADYFRRLKEFLVEEKKQHVVFPPGPMIFNAFNHTPPDEVKVVIMGQDPYHGAGQAHGLCFSVQTGIKPPPSLVNIFKELHSEFGHPVPTHGNLEKWASQGVLLLNATLTVRANQPRSHFNKGWEHFTTAVIRKLSDSKRGLVFMLWGNDAREKEQLVDTSKHHILKAAHPSPFSAYNGFFGCNHFRKANELLKSQGMSEIDWSL